MLTLNKLKSPVTNKIGPRPLEMFNIHSKEYETPETVLSQLGSDAYKLNCFSGPSTNYGNGKSTDNAGVQDFGMGFEVQSSRIILRVSNRRRKARNCTTEFTLSGHNLGIHQGLQILLVKSKSETRTASGYSNTGNANVIPGSSFTSGAIRPDFPSVERYYLIAFDPDLCHIVETPVVVNNSQYNIWHVQADTAVRAQTWELGDDVKAFYGEEGRMYAMYVTLSGIDYLKAARLCQTEVAPPSELYTDWIEWVIDSSIEELVTNTDQKDIVKAKQWIAPVVKYSEQFRDAEEIYRVGHLRFVRLADGTIGGKSDSVLDHVQWYGVMPILNVENSVQITLDDSYFKYHTHNGCKDACEHVTLELTNGKYAVDVNKTCFYYGKRFKYPHGKKAWILSMLANSQVIIEKTIADRIIPVGQVEDMSNIAYNDDDDFLNRF